jgi:hypothetical protein
MYLEDIKIVKAALRGLRPTGPHTDFNSAQDADGYYLRVARGGRSFIIKGCSPYSPKLIEVGLGEHGINWEMLQQKSLTSIKEVLLSIKINA